MHFHAPFPMHRCSRIVALASRHVEAITPAGRAYVSRRKGGGKACEPRKKIGHFHVFVFLLQSPTQIALKCVSHQVSTTTHLSRGTLTCMRTLLEHTCDSTCEGTRAERACGGTANGSSRGASARHSAMRCACRHGVWEGAVGRESRPTAPASHVDDEACISFCMLREGKSANDPPPRAHHHHASGSFMC